MRAERLLSLMLLLRTQGQLTASDLSQQLNVSERTIYRDVQTLSLAGIPIYTIEGRGGGIGLDERYRVALAGLNRQDVQALFVSGASAPIKDLGLATSNEQTLLKLLDALPALHRAEAHRVRQRIHIDPTAWFSSDGQSSTAFVSQVQEAVLGDYRIEIVYRRTNGETFQRTIEAYGMVAKLNVWYLIGAHEGQFRSYRVSRILNLSVTDETFERDSDFNLRQFWQEQTRAFVESIPQYPVILHVHADWQEWVGSFLSLEPAQLSPTDDADWLRITVQFDTQAQALTALIGIAQHIQIISPPDLLDHLKRFAQNINEYLLNM